MKTIYQWLTSPHRMWRQRCSRREAASFYRPFIKPGDLVFDVGANYGERTAIFLSLGARVVAVEPQAACCRFLRHVYGKRITVVEKGVGAEIGEATLHISAFSPVATFSESHANSVRFGGDCEGTQIRAITTLDKLIKEHGEPVFIKIDVEGFEFEALRGLSLLPSAISLEYALPEHAEILRAGAERLMKLGSGTRWNYSPAETLSFKSPHWLAAQEFLALTRTPTFQQESWGDYYVTSSDSHPTISK